ncbi:MAG: ABC transporter permease [Pseudonocardia sp.]|nr:ABC transporter permease [Pseudonocardia sp.]
MASTTVELGIPLAVAVVLAGLAAAALGRATQLGTGPATITAAGRAVLQLGAVSLLIGAIVGSLLLSAAFVLLMVVIAAGTGARRMTRARNGWWALLPVALPLPVVAALVAGGVVPPTGLAIVPTAGILVGGAMTATVLAGRRALDELATRRGEVEAALSLGLLPRDAAVEIARPAAAQALTPVMDQTRTVGLVTLPGAFVGMLLGGASPLAAGAVQLLVLIVLLLVETVAVAVVIDLVCRGLITRPA